MTEVPDHLLARSRARRAALGLGGGDDGGGAAPAADTGTAVEAAPAAASPAPAAAAAVEVAPPPPKPVPHYVAASNRRKRVPVWAMPVLAFLPVWGVLYAQTLSPVPRTEPTQLELGKTVYGKCSGCHGGGGGGGSGRPLSAGAVVSTFPDKDVVGSGITGQVEFINLGSEGFLGKVYGDPAKEGGPHIAGTYTGGAKMPPWHAGLTPLEVFAVARYEREVLGGEKIDKARLGPEEELLWPNGKPMVDAKGELIDADGKPMVDSDGKLLVRPAYEG